MNQAAVIKDLIEKGAVEEAFTLAAEPLHEALYRHQSFELLKEMKVEERVALAFDYIRTQVGQGGFLQLIQNGYVELLLTVIEGLQEMQAAGEMSRVLDDVLKVYVLNIEVLSKEASVADFARLYEEFGEFDALEKKFNEYLPDTLRLILLNMANTD